MSRRLLTLDANEAVASVAHRTNDVIAIYPITPSSNMGEWADEWSSKGHKNIWGNVPEIVEMQSEGGAAGAVHGAIQAGALATTFTSSQGLLLMIPNMYKIAGELTPFVMHVAARTIATHALSIFGDHSDVMACRQTGFALLSSNSVQEAHDFAIIAQAASLDVPDPLPPLLRRLPHVARGREDRGARERRPPRDARRGSDRGAPAPRSHAGPPGPPRQRAEPGRVLPGARGRQRLLPWRARATSRRRWTASRSGRGARTTCSTTSATRKPTRVIVLMGSGAETAHETVDWLVEKGEKVGVLKVRLYRPFDVPAFLAALPKTVQAIAVLDRTKEPGAIGDPLYLDVVTALVEARREGASPLAAEPLVVGGRYGLSSKEFTPGMVKAVFDELAKPKPKNHFTIGIMDDVTHTSLPWDAKFDIEPASTVRALFYGLGADGTVGANKNSIKIIGEETDNFAQGYFVYDSKKSGAVTISHLRFGPKPIRSAYLITRANFVACHQEQFLDRYDMLEAAVPGAVFLVNTPYGPAEAWDSLPLEMQEQILEKRLEVWVIDAYKVAKALGMGGRINTIMQTCFFAISGVLPREEAIAQIKKAIEKTYGKKGEETVRRNFAAVDGTLANLAKMVVPTKITSTRRRPPIVSDAAPDFVKRVSGVMLEGKGDLLPVSAFPPGGTWPLATAQWEKRNIALEIPVWDEKICIQCNKCAMVCPHAAIRAKVFDPAKLEGAPATYKSVPYKGTEYKGMAYTIQIAPEDCTGCTLCVAVCPAKDKANPKHKSLDMAPQRPLRDAERDNFAFFLDLPEADRTTVRLDVKGAQFLRPLFEFSGACSGCGETPYVKLLTQLFGDRALIANATGCSSIYGGNLPTTPYATNAEGRGPAWSNSLFEDNAEFGLGFRLALDSLQDQARTLVKALSARIGGTLAEGLLAAQQDTEAGIAAQREKVLALREALAGVNTPESRHLLLVADSLVKKSVWIVGGDGWAYDIGYGGLDHVLASGRKVNVLVLDTEVYSNTGGQQSKATPMGAAAKFAAKGKSTPKKDLGMLAMTYGNVYVAHVAFGAKDAQTVKAFLEAESYPGTSIVIAYSPCIAHGYDLGFGLDQQKLATESGYWPLYRFDPRRIATGETPLLMDTATIKGSIATFMRNEARFRMVEQQDPERFRGLLVKAEREVKNRFQVYENLAKLTLGRAGVPAAPATPPNPPVPSAAGKA